ncbi:hypothetical protein ACFW6K_27630 [Streptomyces sp. NPDC058733]|uniref:hypothetical protein n=1 Tax=Streptomyces sp. NPDC058733 TaxID=3346614 RepID=UPI003688A63C
MRKRGVQLRFWGPLAQGRDDLFSNPVLNEIGIAHGKSGPGRSALDHPARHRGHAQVRPTQRMAENIDVFDLQLAGDEMNRIATLDTDASSIFDHREPESVSWLGSPLRHLTPSHPSRHRVYSGAACVAVRSGRPVGA